MDFSPVFTGKCMWLVCPIAQPIEQSFLIFAQLDIWGLILFINSIRLSLSYNSIASSVHHEHRHNKIHELCLF